MADLKISEMTPAAELTGAELIECVQGGVNVKQELTGLKTWVNDGVQPFSSTLDALSSFNTNGVMVQTAADTFTGRTITAGTGISVTNGDGVAGNPTISLPTSGVTAATYGSATVVPVVTVNAQGVVTSVTTSSITFATTFSDSVFRVQDNGDATKQKAWELSGITTGTTRTQTAANVSWDEGDLSSVATTNSNVLTTGLRSHIVGGDSNTVSGTGCIAINGFSCNLSGLDLVAINSKNIKTTYDGFPNPWMGRKNVFLNCDGGFTGTSIGTHCVAYINVAFDSVTFSGSLQAPYGSFMVGDRSGSAILYTQLLGSVIGTSGNILYAGGGNTEVYSEVPAYKTGTQSITVHRIKLVCYSGANDSSYGAVLEREVVVSTTSGAILSTTTIGTDVTWGAAVYAPAFSIVSGKLRITCPHTTAGYSSGIRAYVTSYYA